MVEQVHIPYEEYRAITDLMRAHLQTHEGRLRALIAFGDLVTQGNTFDIDLLEVVEGWQGQPSAEFSTSTELPLRGRLRLHLLTPEDFEHPAGAEAPAKKYLLDRVREGYDVVYEDPPGYARNILTQTAGGAAGGNPLKFLVASDAGRP